MNTHILGKYQLKREIFALQTKKKKQKTNIRVYVNQFVKYCVLYARN